MLHQPKLDSGIKKSTVRYLKREPSDRIACERREPFATDSVAYFWRCKIPQPYLNVVESIYLHLACQKHEMMTFVSQIRTNRINRINLSGQHNYNMQFTAKYVNI